MLSCITSACSVRRSNWNGFELHFADKADTTSGQIRFSECLLCGISLQMIWWNLKPFPTLLSAITSIARAGGLETTFFRLLLAGFCKYKALVKDLIGWEEELLWLQGGGVRAVDSGQQEILPADSRSKCEPTYWCWHHCLELSMVSTFYNFWRVSRNYPDLYCPSSPNNFISL